MNIASTRGVPIARSLRHLARQFGVQTSFTDFSGRRKAASPESVLAATRELGAHVHTLADVPGAVATKARERWNEVIEPVVVAQPETAGWFDVRLPERLGRSRLACTLDLEDGTTLRWRVDPTTADVREAETVDNRTYLRTRVRLPRDVPMGYHQLAVEHRGKTWRALVIAAPMRAWSSTERSWGAFLPLYAAHSNHSWGAGDFSDLARVQDWVGGLGGRVVSVLPLLAAYLDVPFDPSPYAPVSRLFWNEFYVDPRRAPELSGCPEARRLLASTIFNREVAAHQAGALVDYRGQMALKRRVLELLAGSAFRLQNDGSAEFRRYADEHPSLREYAAFRAVTEHQQRPWTEWPEPLARDVWTPGSYQEPVYQYYLYAQWLATQQIDAVASAAQRGAPGLYLDLPLGVHRHGYDAWRYRDVFAAEASGGAPPDEVFTRGQDWQFPPLHPDAIRRQQYRYVIDSLRHQMTHASVLRIDHVMGLHRLFWIPKGLPAEAGVYVRYRSEELYAILSCESHRHRATIVGENLGTVPPAVNTALARHGIQTMYVVQYEARAQPRHPLRPVPAGSVASLNTHDMPPFAAYLRGLDFRDRTERGLLPAAQLGREQRARRRIRRALATFFHRTGAAGSASEDEGSLVKAALRWLGASRALVVLVNLEDLWREAKPQNVPGTGPESQSWRRRARHPIEQLQDRPDVVGPLRALGKSRAEGAAR